MVSHWYSRVGISFIKVTPRWRKLSFGRNPFVIPLLDVPSGVTDIPGILPCSRGAKRRKTELERSIIFGYREQFGRSFPSTTTPVFPFDT
jgi:hypothetical protein